MLARLQVFADRMLADLDLTGGATTGGRFTDVIAQDDAITSHLTPSQVGALLNPARHTGHSAAIARLTADRTRRHITNRSGETGQG